MNMRPWKCANGHVLGLARRNDSQELQLLLYREALDMRPGAEKIDVDVIAVIYNATDIRCSVCDDIRSWSLDRNYRKRLERDATRRHKLTLDK